MAKTSEGTVFVVFIIFCYILILIFNFISRHESFRMEDVEALINKLAFLQNMGENPVDILSHIIPIVHLFRLFNGFNALELITTPM